MILGVYWYYKFPEGLYRFQFFNFLEGYGGHANNAAELAVRVQVNDLEDFIMKLDALKAQFKKAYLFLQINENQLIITIGDYQLFDFHFQFALEVERLLFRENVVVLDHTLPFKAQSNKTYHPESEHFESIEHRFIQLVSSNFKKNNAENFSIRIDCNLPLIDKRNFIEDLIQICRDEDINIFHHQDHDFNDHCNLMLFFTNGRQTKDNIQNININSLGGKVRQLTSKYSLHFGHFGGFQYYPRNGPHIELMVDEEYIINTTF